METNKQQIGNFQSSIGAHGEEKIKDLVIRLSCSNLYAAYVTTGSMTELIQGHQVFLPQRNAHKVPHFNAGSTWLVRATPVKATYQNLSLWMSRNGS